jgi:hypothetical protein
MWYDFRKVQSAFFAKEIDSMYDNRLIDGMIRDYLTELPAILVEGAKTVGKT